MIILPICQRSFVFNYTVNINDSFDIKKFIYNFFFRSCEHFCRDTRTRTWMMSTSQKWRLSQLVHIPIMHLFSYPFISCCPAYLTTTIDTIFGLHLKWSLIRVSQGYRTWSIRLESNQLRRFCRPTDLQDQLIQIYQYVKEHLFLWCGAGSNCRHRDFQSRALPSELPHLLGPIKNPSFLRAWVLTLSLNNFLSTHR